ncbi:MAG: hypothetical protein U5N85_18940 [Arcicella sp.]|nr:hypothetical protein [Arcicella sp.]
MLNFNTISQVNTANFVSTLRPLYSLTDENSKGIPTLRLKSSRFLVYQSFATSSNIDVPVDLSAALQRSRNQITETNTIPIGILNAEIDFLNHKEKELVIAASPLQEDLFQADVQFKISPKLMQSNLANSIESIELSFDEGKSWKSYSFSDQLIPHHFDKMDEQTIGIKLNTKKGTYITFTEINIRQLERPKVFLTKSVTVKSEISNPKAKVLESVSGGEYRILLGCDGVFDKPVIVAEGFDAGNNVNLDDITAKYYRYLYALRNNGFDLVVVNYNDGRTFIQNNGNVLIAVINQVNATKVGNNKLVVIGESMSGLVARWALRDMELSNITHNVSHFVAFDSPMQGANVPPGFIALRRWIPDAAFPVSNIFSLLNDIFNVIPEVRAIDEPAAKQLLLTFNGGSPASEFTAFQAVLNNIGYPRQNGIRNIALIDGSLNGTRQPRFTVSNNILTPIGELNPGDQMMDNTEILILKMKVWSNNPGLSTQVFKGEGTGIPLDVYRTSPICLDRVPGGRISFNRGSIYSSFSFVPTFSSIDYRGNLNNDGDYTFRP